MNLEGYLKAISERRETPLKTARYLGGELGVCDNFTIALGAQFIDVVDYFRNSDEFAYSNSRYFLHQRIKPDTQVLKDAVKKLDAKISNTIYYRKEEIETDLERKIPFEQRGGIDIEKLDNEAYELAKEEYRKGNIYSGGRISFNGLDTPVIFQIIDMPLNSLGHYVSDEYPIESKLVNERLQEGNYRTKLLLHLNSHPDWDSSKPTDICSEANGANAITRFARDYIIKNNVEAVFPDSNGNKHRGEFDRIVFYDPQSDS